MINKEFYVIFTVDSTDTRKYVYDIGRSSVYTDKDRESAIKFDTKQCAIEVMNYLSKRQQTNYLIAKVSVVEEIIGDSNLEVKEE